MTCVLFRHPSSLEHDMGPHPEQPARITAIERELEACDWAGFTPRESPAATDAQLRAVHPAAHVERIRALAEAGGGPIDGDTRLSRGSWDAARHAAGGAVAMVDALLSGAATRGAAVHRPPGHHCETAVPMGFCLLNNVAVAARHARDAHGVGRVLVLDWDVHHGNGTEEIFAGTDQVLFCSLHEHPLYPGTGRPADRGHGPGAGFTLNLPLPAGSGDPEWTGLVERVVLPVARAYDPGLLLVSAGYDAHRDDPLASCLVTDEGFATMAGSVHRLADELGVPLGLVLEGGYDVAALARSLRRTLETWSGPVPPAPAVVPTPILEAAEGWIERHPPLRP
ncbi:histone deacetylase [Patulibacter brassicae]|uniref:Histone deacetylase n=1 Tax=Patulibacter brassicae TaxID=1705717 RepID=A0ABU4VGG9_9ACTN|nr:histone deacetylase [Patulibacter brassicae]MDX8150910.1 histone deacetylase [Patulibacter brassicae]